LASSWQVGEVVWDRYYHVISSRDCTLLELLRELGLTEELKWRTTRTNFYDGEALYPLNDVFDYLRLPALGLVDKLRIAATILYASRIEDGRRLERLSAEAWLMRLSGRRTYRNLWRPLLRSKLGSNHERVSASYIWSVIRRFYGARRGRLKRETFGYVAGGYGRVLETLGNRLCETGVVLETGRPVSAIVAGATGFDVTTGEVVRRFDRVVNTCASPIAAGICKDLAAPERVRHEAMAYQGIVCASLLLDRPLGGAYLTYITDESIPFTTVIEMSSLIDPSMTGGKYLVYLPKYLPSDDPLLAVDDQEIQATFLPALRRMFPDLAATDVKAFKVTRTRQVLALATLNYSDRLPPMATSQPGLYIINSAQIVNASLSIDETVKLANEGAAYLLADAAEGEGVAAA
jgi:protoporphyrinogen oxidase